MPTRRSSAFFGRIPAAVWKLLGLALLLSPSERAHATHDPNAYLGLDLPGLEPEVFAPGVISMPDAYEYGSVFTEDGLELFFGVNVGERAEIRSTRWLDGKWTTPSVVLGNPRYTFGDPFLSVDEDRLYFISNRPLKEETSPPKDFDIWSIERNKSGWGQPVNVGSPVNSAGDEYYISFAQDGRLYFASDRNDKKDQGNFDVFSAPESDAGFGEALTLEGDLNTGRYEADAFVAPDESYILYGSTRPEGLGRGDLYISLRRDDGTWSKGTNLGPKINSAGHELCPFVTADERLLFFTSKEDVYWVDAAILDEFR